MNVFPRVIAGAAVVSALVFGGSASAADERILSPQDPDLAELSGIAADPHRDAFWVHQDAGKPSDLSLIGADGATVGTVLPLDVTWEDPEDIGVGPLRAQPRGGLYVADTGDAAAIRSADGSRSRTQFQISRGELPVLAPGEGRAEPFQSLRFTYPDGGNRNVEAMIVDPASGDCWLITKTVDEPTEVFVVPESGFGRPSAPAELRGQLPLTGVSGGSADPYGRFVVLRDATTAYLYPVSSGGIGEALERRPTRVPLPDQPQGEGITVTRTGDALVINSEGVGQPFWRVDLPASFAQRIPAAPTGDLSAVDPAAESSSSRTLWPVVTGLLLLVVGVAVILYGRRQKSSL